MRRVEDLEVLMEKVNDYWISQNPEVGDCSWERAAYFLGNVAAYEVLGKQRYLDYAVAWAEQNDWNFYDNEDHNVTDADYLSCGETYMDLMTRYGIKGRMDHMAATMEWTAQDPNNDYWWWVDTMYMALNFYNRMGLYLQEERLVDKAYNLYRNSKVERTCYDEEYGLWFRDENFLPDRVRTRSGKKVFWSRGNGWVLGGLARTLRTLKAGHRYYEEYKNVFVKMARALRECQGEDGFWRTSLLEPEEFPMPETSGTALNILGMLIGVREKILDEGYMECVWKGFEALTCEALEESGRIGWVQVVALKPGPVKKECTNDYAVGTYLLICRELIEYIREKEQDQAGCR